jgi:hypothetical protein
MYFSGSVQQYKGKTVDFLMYDGAKPSGDTQVLPALVQEGQSGALITGPAKLAQRFLLELLTDKGSLQYDINRGTFFMTQIRSGLARTSADLFQIFAASELDLRNNLRLEDDTSFPDDERYASSELLDASFIGDAIYLRIQLNSVAGESREVLFPLRIPAVQL